MKKLKTITKIILLVFILDIICFDNTIYKEIKQVKDNIKIEKHIKYKKIISKKNNDVLGIIYIPKIKLKKIIIKENSKNNNINKNIKTIKYSNPENKNSTIVLAAHSGTSNVSYFKNLSKLKENDKIFLYIRKYKYEYKIIKKYKIKKTGYLEINDEKNKIILTTCDMKNKDRQLVVIGTNVKSSFFK